MKALVIVIALLILGDAVTSAYGLPVPGPAVGLFALTLWFVWRGGTPDAEVAALFDAAAPRFQLLFVPAAVGLVANLDLLADSLVFFAVAIIGGTAAALVATGLIAQALLRRTNIKADADA